MNYAAKLEQVENRARQLLDEMNEIDVRLSTLSPADPARVGLKAQKADILPRYRGAKQQVKSLRRLINSGPPAETAVSVTKVVDQALLFDLYVVITELLEADVADQFSSQQLATLSDFCDRMDPEDS